ncbi:MAG: GNAT family N-acetyltransferase [Corynebacteriales bacterium]|nr:GNAT family N-acetyltransferase [Mycobacteriales bacterium]
MAAFPGWPVTLTQGPITLRPHRRGDAQAWARVRIENETWLSQWEPTSSVPWKSRHRSADFRAMFRVFRQATRAAAMMPFVITYEGQFAGQLSLINIIRGAAGSAVAGYWLDQRLAGRGIMPLSLAMVIDHAFTAGGLHRIEVNIRPENSASIRVVEKLGLRQEGYFRRFLHIDGDWRDHMGYALTTEDLPAGGMLAAWRQGTSATHRRALPPD